MTVPGSDTPHEPPTSGLVVLEDGPWYLLRFPGLSDERCRYRLVWVDLTRTPHTFQDHPRPDSSGDP